jgi:hypothetical protein
MIRRRDRDQDKKHVMDISPGMYQWAREKGATLGVGWATYIRSLAEREMAKNGHAEPRNPDTPPPIPGKAVHQECYKDMVRDWRKRFPGEETPSANPYTARRVTICPYCSDQVREGDFIVMTTMSEWNR